MIVIGVIVLIVGWFLPIQLLVTLGIILVLIGVVLEIVGRAGYPVGGRRHYW